MSYIKLSSGKFYFTPKHLYVGIKPINKELAAENLKLFQTILDTHNIQWGLAFGTVLGAVREHDFISHDEDIDVYVLSENEDQFKELLPILKENKFDLIRYERRGLYSIERNGEYIDIYIFYPYKKGIRNNGADFMLESHLLETKKISLRNVSCSIPQNYTECMEILYGKTWMIPIPYTTYNLSKIQILKHKIISDIKQMLPDNLYHLLLKRHINKRYNVFKKTINLANYLHKK